VLLERRIEPVMAVANAVAVPKLMLAPPPLTKGSAKSSGPASPVGSAKLRGFPPT
jgi:hypothetical protein